MIQYFQDEIPFISNLDMPNISIVREKSCTQLQIYRFSIVQNVRSFVFFLVSYTHDECNGGIFVTLKFD